MAITAHPPALHTVRPEAATPATGWRSAALVSGASWMLGFGVALHLGGLAGLITGVLTVFAVPSLWLSWRVHHAQD